MCEVLLNEWSTWSTRQWSTLTSVTYGQPVLAGKLLCITSTWTTMSRSQWGSTGDSSGGSWVGTFITRSWETWARPQSLQLVVWAKAKLSQGSSCCQSWSWWCWTCQMLSLLHLQLGRPRKPRSTFPTLLSLCFYFFYSETVTSEIFKCVSPRAIKTVGKVKKVKIGSKYPPPSRYFPGT